MGGQGRIVPGHLLGHSKMDGRVAGTEGKDRQPPVTDVLD